MGLDAIVDWQLAPPTLVEQRALACHGSIWRRRALAVNTTEAELLWILLRDPCADVRCGLAHNPHTPQAIIARLCVDRDGGVRACAASRTTDEELLQRLIVDRDPRVWRTALHNPALNPERAVAVIRLHPDNDSERLAILVQHPRCSAALLEELLCTSETSIRRHCAQHPNLGRRAILRYRWLRQRPAHRRLHHRLRAAWNNQDVIDTTLLRNPRTPRWMLMLAWLRRDDLATVLAMADNPSCPWLLQVLLTHRDEAVHVTLARNSCATRGVLRRMVGGRRGIVRLWLCYHHWYVSSSARRWALKGIVVSEERTFLEMVLAEEVLRHPRMPRGLMRVYVHHSSSTIRGLLADRTDLPRAVRRRLLRDPDQEIVCKAIGQSRRLPRRLTRQLWLIRDGGPTSVALALAAHPALRPRHLHALIYSRYSAPLRRLLVRNPGCPLAQRRAMMFSDHDPLVWSALAADPDISADERCEVLLDRLTMWSFQWDPYGCSDAVAAVAALRMLVRSGQPLPTSAEVFAAAAKEARRYRDDPEVTSRYATVQQELCDVMLATDAALSPSEYDDLLGRTSTQPPLMKLLHRRDQPPADGIDRAIAATTPRARERIATATTDPDLLVRLLLTLPDAGVLRVLERGMWRETHVWEGYDETTREQLRGLISCLASAFAGAPTPTIRRRGRRILRWLESPATLATSAANSSSLSSLLD